MKNRAVTKLIPNLSDIQVLAFVDSKTELSKWGERFRFFLSFR